MTRQSTLNLLSPLLFITAVFSAPLYAVPVPVDLSSWQVDGAGNWTLQSNPEPNDTAFQSLNSIPTVLFNGVNSQGTALSGTIQVLSSGGDDDFVGFVLGYDDEDLFGTNSTTDYILLDWKVNRLVSTGQGFRYFVVLVM